MIESPGFLIYFVAFLCVIGPLVFVHEMGHYAAARWFGVKIEAFSIGMGREIAGWTDRHGTRWKLAWLPLGGYVRFAGDMNAVSRPSAEWLALPASERGRTFQAKPVWQRAIIVAAGPAVNLLLAVLILAGFAHIYGVRYTAPIVAGVSAGSPAAAAGLLPGDRIVSLGGRTVARFDDVANYLLIRPGEKVSVVVDRGGAQTAMSVTVGEVRQQDRFGNEYRIGRLGIASPRPEYRPAPLLQAPGEGVRLVGQVLRNTLDALGQIITGRRSIKELGGPLKIAKTSGEQFSLGWPEFITLIAMVSINLGFINLLPVPMLDGGHLFFYAIEAVRRRPVGPQVQEWAYRGGLAALLTLMLVVTINDLGSFGLWQRLGGLFG
ncbi:MAG: rseP [Sphingomonas bacterium]|uniref:M50 family metallopeptidase n=1 Tax=Sphingomonas bacterium TaxID=1895847 RepID=UPI00260EB8B9|nr:M50 family metallopeptidase [Sphingomonas bacterium]MDB5697022.1 rseP [Sphingomonas bacterium]